MGMDRKPMELQFLAEPEEVPALRRIVRLHLTHWGLLDLIEPVQLCVTELITNVIKHVGCGTPTTLVLSYGQAHLRIEVRDPDGRALPTLLDASLDDVGGRGMQLISGTAARWGVIPTASGKTTWAEFRCLRSFPATLAEPDALMNARLDPGLARSTGDAGTRLGRVRAREAGVGLIGDVLCRLRAQGYDPDDVLASAQMQFEADASGGGAWNR
ncbi:ATP-binding protein [Streptomyces sp. NPDC048340]|uniref:ATP-binding protein n=1 Tax=Streptomyces sp. NPDC048340 TaxID=3365537 RepID=UPI003719CF26